MTQESSLYGIFQNMDLSNDKNTLELPKQWAKKHSDLFKEETYKKFTYNPSNSTSEWHKFSTKVRGQKIHNFVEELKKNRTLLIESLCYAMFNNADSASIVSLLIQQLDYYSGLTYIIKDLDSSKCVVDVHIEHCDLPILGQLLGPILSAGYTVRIRIERTNVFLPYILLLGKIIMKSEFPDGVYTLLDSKEEVNDQHICIENTNPQYYCPMIIFEDSDIDSAVECIIQGAWRYCGTLTWSLTHVFAHESIYMAVTAKLKERSSKLHLGPKFDRNCDFIEMPEIVKFEQMGNLEVFKPFETSMHRIFVGWDPLQNEASSSPRNPLGVSVMPFRTISEVISLVNKSHFGCTASVWTERISTANRMFEKLEVGTVWINAHGLVDPAVPLESLKETKYPINGKPLLCALINRATSEVCERAKVSQCDETSSLGQHFIRSDIRIAVETARAAQKSWMNLSSVDRYKKIYSVVNDLEQNFSTELPKNTISTLYHIVISARFVVPSFSQTVGSMNVQGTSKPFGVIWIKLSNSYALLQEQLIIMTLAALVNGNAVIISAETDELKSVALHVCGMLRSPELPEGLLNIATDANRFPEGSSNENIYCKVINRFITLGSSDASSKCVSFMFGRNIDLPMDGVDFFKSPELLNFLIYQNKVMWMPNK